MSYTLEHSLPTCSIEQLEAITSLEWQWPGPGSVKAPTCQIARTCQVIVLVTGVSHEPCSFSTCENYEPKLLEFILFFDGFVAWHCNLYWLKGTNGHCTLCFTFVYRTSYTMQASGRDYLTLWACGICMHSVKFGLIHCVQLVYIWTYIKYEFATIALW